MNPILSAGALIGVLCTVWMFTTGFMGWYKDPALSNLFFLVIAIEIGGLIWGLRRTAAMGKSYGQQVVAGTMMAVIAGIIIVAASLVFTMVVFPDYASALESATRASLERQGRSEAEIAEALRANAASATPMAQAMSGFIGTLITGIVASAVIAIFVRSRRPASAVARRT